MKKIITFSIIFLVVLAGITYAFHNYSMKYQYVGFYYGKNKSDTLFIIKKDGTGYSYRGLNTTDLIIPIGSFKWHINPQSKYNAIMIDWSGLNSREQMEIGRLLSSVILGSNLEVKDNFKNKLFFAYRDRKDGEFKLGIYGTKSNL